MICGVWSGVMVACGHTFLYLTRFSFDSTHFALRQAPDKTKNPQPVTGLGINCGQKRDRTADLPLFRRTLYRLSYLARLEINQVATLTGLEPATSAVTGRRANQLRHRALNTVLNFLAYQRCARVVTLQNRAKHKQIASSWQIF